MDGCSLSWKRTEGRKRGTISLRYIIAILRLDYRWERMPSNSKIFSATTDVLNRVNLRLSGIYQWMRPMASSANPRHAYLLFIHQKQMTTAKLLHLSWNRGRNSSCSMLANYIRSLISDSERTGWVHSRMDVPPFLCIEMSRSEHLLGSSSEL